MTISSEKVSEIIRSLALMKNRAPDDKGAYLGTGSAVLEPLRAGDMEKLLAELLAWRTQVSDFEYDPVTGNILYTGDLGD